MTLTADPGLIEQVLINLLLNALQATEERDEAEIALEARIDDRRPAGHPGHRQRPRHRRRLSGKDLRAVLQHPQGRLGHRPEPLAPDHAHAPRRPDRPLDPGVETTLPSASEQVCSFLQNPKFSGFDGHPTAETIKSNLCGRFAGRWDYPVERRRSRLAGRRAQLEPVIRRAEEEGSPNLPPTSQRLRVQRRQSNNIG